MTPDQQFAQFTLNMINTCTVPVAEIGNVQQTQMWLKQIAEGAATIARPVEGDNQEGNSKTVGD